MENYEQFQFTLPRRERHANYGLLGHEKDFNSRSREGSDTLQQGNKITVNDFNSRSREGSD